MEIKIHYIRRSSKSEGVLTESTHDQLDIEPKGSHTYDGCCNESKGVSTRSVAYEIFVHYFAHIILFQNYDRNKM